MNFYLFSDTPGIQTPIAATDYAENIYWVYGLVLDDNVPFDAAEVIARLSESKIGTRSFFWPMHEQPVFKKMGLFDGVTCPVAEKISRRGFYIPSGLAITETQIQQVAVAVKRVVRL